MNSFVITGGTILTVDKNDSVFIGDIFVKDDKIVDIAVSGRREITAEWEKINASDCYVMPGLIQAHVHLAQVLFRGLAEDLPLLAWLKERIFLFEAAHRRESVFASAQLGIVELLLSGTTSCLDMGTVHHTDAIFQAAQEWGFRLTSGKAMMDDGDDVPSGLKENSQQSIDGSIKLAQQWHNNGLTRYAFAPRFILSCTETLIRDVVFEARKLGCRLHTHASENPGEVKAVFERTGMNNIEALHHLGFTGSDVMLAHGVHLSDNEVQILAETGTHIAHCPTTNLKLASGIADVPRLQSSKINVGIGCDGAPCNNALDGFIEMHLAALLQKIHYGATSMPAKHVLRMATIDGAKLLGIDDQVGSLEAGKKADIVILSSDRAHLRPIADPFATVVHACRGSDVRDVWINGRHVIKNSTPLYIDLPTVLNHAEQEIAALKKRL